MVSWCRVLFNNREVLLDQGPLSDLDSVIVPWLCTLFVGFDALRRILMAKLARAQSLKARVEIQVVAILEVLLGYLYKPYPPRLLRVFLPLSMAPPLAHRMQFYYLQSLILS